MLLNLIQKKKLILTILSVILLIFWTITLLFGNGEDKITVLVLSLIFPFIVYGFMRLTDKMIRINASLKAITFFICFYLFAGGLVIVIDTVGFITAFPNGLNPTLGCGIGLIAACLDDAEKNIVN